jgi:hypothetical protein
MWAETCEASLRDSIHAVELAVDLLPGVGELAKRLSGVTDREYVLELH